MKMTMSRTQKSTSSSYSSMKTSLILQIQNWSLNYLRAITRKPTRKISARRTNSVQSVSAIMKSTINSLSFHVCIDSTRTAFPSGLRGKIRVPVASKELMEKMMLQENTISLLMSWQITKVWVKWGREVKIQETHTLCSMSGKSMETMIWVEFLLDQEEQIDSIL